MQRACLEKTLFSRGFNSFRSTINLVRACMRGVVFMMMEGYSLEYKVVTLGPLTPKAEMFPTASKFCDKNQRLRETDPLFLQCVLSLCPVGQSQAEFSYLGNGTSDLSSDLLWCCQACIRRITLKFLAHKYCCVIVTLVKIVMGRQ